MSIGLWVGAVAFFFLRRPQPEGARASEASPWRSALAVLAPPALIGMLQAVVLTGVLRYLLDIDIARPGMFLGFALLTSLTFVAINQAFVALLGTKGRFMGLILIVLQLSTAGATYPIESSPAFFQVLHPLLPLTYSVRAFRTLIAGGSLHVDSSALVMLVWLVASFAATIITARRDRMWEMSRLRPTMSL